MSIFRLGYVKVSPNIIKSIAQHLKLDEERV